MCENKSPLSGILVYKKLHTSEISDLDQRESISQMPCSFSKARN